MNETHLPLYTHYPSNSFSSPTPLVPAPPIVWGKKSLQPRGGIGNTGEGAADCVTRVPLSPTCLHRFLRHRARPLHHPATIATEARALAEAATSRGSNPPLLCSPAPGAMSSQCQLNEAFRAKIAPRSFMEVCGRFGMSISRIGRGPRPSSFTPWVL